VQPRQLDRAIDDVLAGADFRWRLHPVAEKKPAESGPLARLFDPVLRWVLDAVRILREGIEDVVDWIVRNLFRQNSERRPAVGAGLSFADVLHLLVYVFIGAAVLLILWLLWIVWHQAAKRRAPVVAARAVPPAAPDLRDDNIQAAQLPADGWLALARVQIGRGEWRLALRALYLATLARLSGEGLISLAKFKTNLDYERELRRRALTRAEIVAQFAARRRAFEDAWYGRAAPGEDDVRHWLADLEGAAPP
jgi:cytochrome c-type biogenesis protein CcmH/NrfG